MGNLISTSKPKKTVQPPARRRKLAATAKQCDDYITQGIQILKANLDAPQFDKLAEDRLQDMDSETIIRWLKKTNEVIESGSANLYPKRFDFRCCRPHLAATLKRSSIEKYSP